MAGEPDSEEDILDAEVILNKLPKHLRNRNYIFAMIVLREEFYRFVIIPKGLSVY